MSRNRLKYIHTYYDVSIQNPIYPNARIGGINPYNERVMSMPTIMNETGELNREQSDTKFKGSYFFFIFNFENYYHFLYDTLPYLHFYFEILKTDPTCRLLLAENHKWLQFQEETFEILGLTKDKIAYGADNAEYEKLYIPSSLTHGTIPIVCSSASNEAPSKEAYNIWDTLAQKIRKIEKIFPKKIYISRRTHLLEDTSNIGTNYTTRRRCINEDELVEFLKTYGYEEVFCETLSMTEKIKIFQEATHVAGFIGGGMANLLFSKSSTLVHCIVTPYFLDINARFKYSMCHTNIKYCYTTTLAPYKGPFPPFIRVKIVDPSSPYNGKIGEIEYWNGSEEKYIVKIPRETVAGFSLSNNYNNQSYSVSWLEPIDMGLNSPFICDINFLKPFINN